MWLRTSHRPPGLLASSSTATPFRPASPTPRCKTVPAPLSAPTQSSIDRLAGTHATKLSSSNFDIVDGPGAGTYPLANFSWTLLYQKQANASTGVSLQRLFTYVITVGQLQAAKLGYAPLPLSVVSLAKSTLAELENSAGKPLSG